MIRHSESHRTGRRARASAAVTLTVLGVAAQAGLGATPAMATLSGPGVGAGRNVTVFHNVDFVGVYGYGPTGEPVTVDVVRDGVTIGTTTGPSVDTAQGPGLEVNHGPVGTPQPGDCWTGTTPDIRPGDRVVVSSAGVQDEVTVDNIRFSGRPAEDLSTGDIVVSGIALRADGTTIPSSSLDSGEFRNSTGKYRINPDVVEPTPGVTGGFTMRYRSPYTGFRNREALTEEQRKQALLGNGHAIGFGHAVPLPAESMLVDGIADVPGPAVGCEAAPAGPGTTPPPPPGGTPPPPAPDTQAPTVTSRTPLSGATQVNQDTNVTVAFSEPVTRIDGTSFTLRTTKGATAARVSYDATGRTATLDPTTQLAAGTTYTVALTATVADVAGNPLAPVSWTFTTARPAPKDTVNPTVTRRTPTSGATKVLRGSDVSVTFSEAVTRLSTTSMTLRSAKKTSVPATVTYDAATRIATLDPALTLEPGTRYTAALTKDITDLAGNRLSAQTWSFTTGS